MYHTTRESVTCNCGGRHSLIPDVIRRHQETKKHRDWVKSNHTFQQYDGLLYRRPLVSFEQKQRLSR